jgi:hypothetical protein
VEAQYHKNPLVKHQHTPQQQESGSARPEGATLAEHHVEYLEARAVDEAAAGMFWTAEKPSEIPPVFSERQRRGGRALIAEFYSPDGETVSWQKRDDRPKRDRRGRVVKWVSPPAERAPVVLAVVPSMLDEVRDGTGPLWSVEGITRAAALAPHGIPAVAYAGCYNWQKDEEPLRCWDYVNLRGRLVFDVPDADARTNAQVQDTQAQRVAFLESRGARVLVVDVPQMNGDEHTGLDDALARGADPFALARAARPFARVDVARSRLRKDERLRLFVAAKRREVGELPATSPPECNARKVARFMVGVAARRGKVGERGVEVPASLPQIAEGVRVGSYQTVRKALELLQGVGFLERVPGRRRPKEATSYLLLDPWGKGSAQGVNIGTSEAEGGEGQEHRAENPQEHENPLCQQDSYLCLHSTHNPENLRKPKSGAEVPPLRSSKLIHTWARREGRRVVVDSDYCWRYGPKREELFRYVLERGEAEPGELHEKFGSKTSRLGRFMQTWVEPMLRDGVLYETDGELIVPSPDWPEALERVKARTDEDTDNRLQSDNYARRRQEYREYLERVRRGEDPKADPTPELKGPDHVAEAIERHRPRWEHQRVEAQRQKVGITAAVFVADELEGASAVRYREMRERWKGRGGKGEDLYRAIQTGPFRFDREADGWLYVYPREAPASAPEREPADVTPLRPNHPGESINRAPKKSESINRFFRGTKKGDDDPHDPGGDWRDHPLDCRCARCGSPGPSYATPWSAS